jgi:hypothetical protein
MLFNGLKNVNQASLLEALKTMAFCDFSTNRTKVKQNMLLFSFEMATNEVNGMFGFPPEERAYI